MMVLQDVRGPSILEGYTSAKAKKAAKPAKPEWFDPSRSDFWNDPNRWDGIDDPHAEIFWMKRRVDRIDCSAPDLGDLGLNMAEYHQYTACISQSTQSPYANAQGAIFGRIFG